MNLYRNLFTYTVFPVLVFGLISCTKEKPQYDTWSSAPDIQIVRDSQFITASEAQTLYSNDELAIVDASRTENLSGAVAAHALIECTDFKGETFSSESPIFLRSKYQVLDLLPLQALPTVIKSHSLNCEIGLRLINQYGSSRKRVLQNIKVEFALAHAEIEVNNEVKNETLLKLTLEDLEYASYRGLANGREIQLKCDDYSFTSQNKDGALRELVNSKVEGLSYDPRHAHPIQRCRLYQRLEDDKWLYSQPFEVTFKTPPYYKISSDTAFKETWRGAFLNVIGFAKYEIQNDKNYPIMIRYSLRPGTVQFRAISVNKVDNVSTIAASFPYTVDLTGEITTSGEVAILTDGNFQYATLQPQASLNILYSAYIGFGCQSNAELYGMDFSFSRFDLLKPQIGNTILTELMLSEFENVYSIEPMFKNAIKPNGKNRQTYYVPWHMATAKPQGPINGDASYDVYSCGWK